MYNPQVKLNQIESFNIKAVNQIDNKLPSQPVKTLISVNQLQQIKKQSEEDKWSREKPITYNKEFIRYEKLKSELQIFKNLCADQYFAVNKCTTPQTCGKHHVQRYFYPCIHFYMGNCKYGFNCLFSHSIKRQVYKPQPAKQVCKKLYFENYCPHGSRCKFSHNLRQEACAFNSLGKCKFSAQECRFSHMKKIDISIPCFFNLMEGCKNENCSNKHTNENIIKYISYQGPI